MKKSLSLFLTLTMTMVLSVLAPSVVCAGTATPKASIEQGWIKPENIYIKSNELPAFALGNMKAADMVALTKYAEGGSPQFHQLNAKTHLWMNSEGINTVNRYKTNYEIAQEALALQKNKLKEPYQAKIDEQVEKYNEKLAAHDALKKKLADLERQADGDFTDEEKKAFCAKINNPKGCPTKDHLKEMEKIAESELDKNKENLEAQIKASEEQLKKDAEAANQIIAENQEKINEIDAAEDAEALGRVKANQEHDVVRKREAAAAAEAAVKEAEDKLNEICPEGSRVNTTCEQENAQAIAEAQEELEKARSDAATAKAAADAANAAEKKIVDQTVAENKLNETVLYTQDRYGKDVADQKMDTIIEEQAQEATNKAVADYMKSDEAQEQIKQRCTAVDGTDRCKNNENLLKQVQAGVEEDFRTGTEGQSGYYQTYKAGLEGYRDTAKETVAGSTSTADYTGVSFNKPKENKRQVPSDQVVDDLASGETN